MTGRLVGTYRAVLSLITPGSWLTRRFIARRLATQALPDGVCLDIGGGNAPFARSLAAARPAMRQVVIDPVPGDCTVVTGDAHRLPFASETAGLVAMFQVVQFLDDPPEALAECRRVLRPDGLLLIAYPFLSCEGRSHDLRRWSVRGMEAELRAAGFEPIAHETLGGPCLFATATLAAMPGRSLIAHRRGWQTGRSPGDALRLALAFMLALPFHILGFPALWLDRIIARPAHYIGGIVLARKCCDA
ncbi:MAG: class I SAM-dependent methyltransferase [Alphaproteobacteria bacterium]